MERKRYIEIRFLPKEKKHYLNITFPFHGWPIVTVPKLGVLIVPSFHGGWGVELQASRGRWAPKSHGNAHVHRLFKASLWGCQETVLSFLLIRSGVQVPLCARFEELSFLVFLLGLFS